MDGNTYRCIASPFALAAWITTVELASDRLVHVVCKAVGVGSGYLQGFANSLYEEIIGKL